MSKMVVGVGVMVLAVGGVAVFVQHEDNARLRREITALREEVRNSTVATRRDQPKNVASAPPSAEAMIVADRAYMGGAEDLTTLREEIVALRKSTQEIARLAQAAQAKKQLDAESAVPTNLIPTNALKNAGKATPESAAETVMWAAVGGDIDTLANAIAFTPSARAKADAWFAGLSPGTREQYGTPEKVVALMLARDAGALGGMQVLGQREITPDNVGVRIRVADAQGRAKDDNFLMHRAADGWRLVLPDAAVEKFARQVGGGR